MACVGEAIGLSLPNSNMAPAPYKSREEIARAAGRQVMELVERQLRPRDICTRAAFENAARVVAATGGSTNGALHLPAMAHECGIEFDLFDVAEIFKSTPYIADLKPGGKYVAKDMHEAGGVYMVMKTLLAGGFLDPEPITVTGKTLGENIEEITWNPDQKVIYDVKAPISPTGGVVGLRGSLAPDGRDRQGRRDEAAEVPRPGASVRVRGGHLRRGRGAQIREGSVIVIRNEGPKGGPGMREMLATTAALYGQGMGEKRRADHRRALFGCHPRLLHRPRRPRGRRLRPDRAGRGGRRDRHRRRGRHDRARGRRGHARRAPAKWRARAGTTTTPAPCGATRRTSARRGRARSRTPARPRKRMSTRTSIPPPLLTA
jgi:dihydroxy-acid dehydratase